MIRLVEGPLGSGKSYYAVAYICKFAEYDKFYREWVLKDSLLLISNIDGLKLPHWNLDECIKKYGIEEFFTIENFEKIRERYRKSHIILAIDETQKYFDVKFYNKSVMFFFEYSRHIGVDIILLTQGATKVARGIIPLLENIVEALPRSISLPYIFRYKFHDNKGNFQYHDSLKKKPEIFAAYRSMINDEVSKPKNALYRYAVVTMIALVLCFGGMTFFLKTLSTRGQKATGSLAHAEQKQQPIIPKQIVKKPEQTEKIDTTEGKKDKYVKVLVDGAIYSEGIVKYYLINGVIVTPDKVKKYDSLTQTALFQDDDMPPEIPKELIRITKPVARTELATVSKKEDGKKEEKTNQKPG